MDIRRVSHASFMASLVEFVEALPIVLAVGVSGPAVATLQMPTATVGTTFSAGLGCLLAVSALRQASAPLPHQQQAA